MFLPHWCESPSPPYPPLSVPGLGLSAIRLRRLQTRQRLYFLSHEFTVEAFVLLMLFVSLTSVLVHRGDSFFMTKTKEFLVEADSGQRQNRPVITHSDGKAALDVASDNIPLIPSSRSGQPERETAWVEASLEIHLACLAPCVAVCHSGFIRYQFALTWY